jgi:hypothetical protein
MSSLASQVGAAGTRVDVHRHARERLVLWLLGDQVQVSTGMHAGAVVAGCDAQGRASYAYPEITGYYLRWLAWRSACGDTGATLRARARAALRWLERWLAAPGVPATRIYLQEAQADWRNDAFFFFDAAMALRGIAAVHVIGLAPVEERVVHALGTRLESLIGRDGRFEACIARPGAADLPARWSTRRGPFLAKAAVGVLEACEVFPATCSSLRAAAQATFDDALQGLVTSAHDEVHPQLYAIEGALALQGSARRHAAAIRSSFDALLAATRRAGHVPESVSRGGAARLDVVAQLLRVAALIDESSPLAVRDHALLDQLAAELAARVEASGAIPFDPGAASPQYNTWVAMFAEQGLADARIPLRTFMV